MPLVSARAARNTAAACDRGDRAESAAQREAMTIAFLVLTAALAAISVIDWRTRRIPDALSLPLVAAGLYFGHSAGASPFVDHLVGAAVGYAALAAFGAGYFRLRGREGLGLGDAKLFAAGGAWLGWQALPLVLLTAALGGLAYVAIARSIASDRDPRIAFGPWLSLAIWLAWIGAAR